MNVLRPTKDQYYCNIAEQVALRSTCLRRHYGAVIVSHDQIISTGYNGSPRGEKSCCDLGICNRDALGCEKGSGYEHCPAVHAEMNAIISAARRDMIGSTIYIVGLEGPITLNSRYWVNGHTSIPSDADVKLYTLPNGEYKVYANPSPCTLCRRMIINAGIARCVGVWTDGSIKEIDITRHQF